MAERPIARALIPWATMAVALALAFGFGGAGLFSRLEALGPWRLLILGAAVTGGLGCSGLLLLTRWPAARRILLAMLPAALPWLSGVALLRAHVGATDIDLMHASDLGRASARELAEAAGGTFVGLSLSAGLLFGITIGAAGASRTRARVAAASAAALGWAAAALAVWHAVVANALHRLGGTDGARWVELLTGAATIAKPVAESVLIGGGTLLVLGLVIALRAEDRRFIALPLVAALVLAGLVDATERVRENALATARAHLDRPWRAATFAAPTVGDQWQYSFDRPFGVIGPSGLQVLGRRPEESPAEALRRIADEREARAARRRDALAADVATPDWMDDAPPPEPPPSEVAKRREAARERRGSVAASERPHEPREDGARAARELADEYERRVGRPPPLCGENPHETVILALDARASAAALRDAIEQALRAGFGFLRLTGPRERAPEALAAIPLAIPMVEMRAWELGVQIRRACEAKEDIPFFTGVVEARPVEAVDLLGRRIPLEAQAMVTHFATPRPLVLALGDDATGGSLAASLGRVRDDMRIQVSERLLFPSVEAMPEPPQALSAEAIATLPLSMTELSVHGGLDEAAIRVGLEDLDEALRECFADVVPRPRGPVSATMIVSPEGRGRSAVVADAESAAFRECLSEALRGMRAEGHSDSGVTVVRFALDWELPGD